MTLLRMLAFRPAAAVEGGSAPGGGAATRATAKSAIVQAAAVQAKRQASGRASAVQWADPDWSALVGQLGLRAPCVCLASNCAYLRVRGNTFTWGLIRAPSRCSPGSARTHLPSACPRTSVRS